MYEKTLQCTSEVFRNGTDDNGSFQVYLRRAWMSDLHDVARAIAADSVCIDGENWLFSILRTDDRSRFPEVVGFSWTRLRVS
jgi:hypothetical protein